MGSVVVASGPSRWLSGTESACQSRGTRDTASIPGWGRSPGEGNGSPLQYSRLENPMDRGAWRATVQRVAKNQTRLKRLSTHAWTWLPCDMWDLPRPGIKPMSPTGSSGFFITEPLRKSWDSFLERVRPVREGSFQQSMELTHCRWPGTQGTRGLPGWGGRPASPLPAQTGLGDRGSLRGE